MKYNGKKHSTCKNKSPITNSKQFDFVTVSYLL